MSWWESALAAVGAVAVYNFGAGLWSGPRRKRSPRWSCPHCAFVVTVRNMPRSEDARRVVDDLALSHLDTFHDDRSERL